MVRFNFIVFAYTYSFILASGDLRDHLHFRHKHDGEWAMRTRNTETMGWGVKVGIGLGIFILASAIGLSIYGGRIHPTQHPVAQTISDDRLPK